MAMKKATKKVTKKATKKTVKKATGKTAIASAKTQKSATGVRG